MGENWDSVQKKGKAKILRWAYANFEKLKECNKVKVWSKVFDKETPDQIQIGGIGGGPVRVIFRASSDLPKPEAR